jgi:transketolase
MTNNLCRDSVALKNLRKTIVKMAHYSKSSHIGGCLSCIDILFVLYSRIMDIQKIKNRSDQRDIFILSKRHNSAALYAICAFCGFFPAEHLDKYYIDDGLLPGHLDMTLTQGIECSTGSLGHGASIGLGFAIAKTRKNKEGHIYVLLGDGECNEGSVWEAAALAATLKQENFSLIIDFNRLQGMGANIIHQDNLAQRFRAFGLKTEEVDGHNIEELSEALKDLKGPNAIIAHTVKGKGVSFMENKLEWHYRSPNDQELKMALEELS